MDSLELRARARRAYELGRLAAGLRGAWPLLALLPLSLLLHGGNRVGLTLLAAAGALVAAVVLGWRGGAFARGVAVGWLAGLPPLLLPMLVMARLEACAHCEDRWQHCLLACAAGGLLAGVLVGWRAARQERAPERFAWSAALIAWLTGLLGCTLIGALGAVGLVIGLAVATVPTLRWARAARA